MPYFEDYLQVVNRNPGIHVIDDVATSIRESVELGVTFRPKAVVTALKLTIFKDLFSELKATFLIKSIEFK